MRVFAHPETAGAQCVFPLSLRIFAFFCLLSLPSLEWALLVVEYHIRRNEVARRSHTKTWMARHKNVKLLPLWN
jgi:hypothetical protein